MAMYADWKTYSPATIGSKSDGSKNSSKSKRPLSAWNLYFQKHMIELSAIERKKTTGRRSSREMLRVVADMWQADKKCSTPKMPNGEPKFHLDANNNMVGFW
jgi:hypothetical protein